MTGSGGERLAGIDAARGAAITFVVLIHAAHHLDAGFYRTHVEGGIARLGVPLFVLLSGVMAGLRETSRPRFRAYFLKFLRLHVLYALLYVPYQLLRNGLPDPISVKWVLLLFGIAGWPGQYYFAIVIQVFLIASLVPSRLWRRTWLLALCAALVPLGLLSLYWVAANVELRRGPMAYLLLSKVHFWYWIYYFALGCWTGDRMRRGVAWKPSAIATALLLATAAWIATFGVPLPLDGVDPSQLSYRRPRFYIATTLVAIALPTFASIGVPRWLQALGRDSFGLFVLNPALLLLLYETLGDPGSELVSLAYAVVVLAVGVLLARQLRERAPWAYA